MIAVVDSSITERSKSLRKKIFTAGFPCAALDIHELAEFKPIRIIVTFCDMFDDLRHMPFDEIFAVVIGNGFVNSALNAVRANNEDEALVLMKRHLLKISGITERNMLPFGILTDYGVFWSKKHFEVYGNIVEPTLSEYMIFKYLASVADPKQFIASEKIRRFCYVRDLADARNIDGNIAAHISNLNSKLNRSYGKRLIKTKRYRGYYFDLENI